MIRRLQLAFVLWVLGATGSLAQTATLVADALRVEQDNRLVAEGSVEVSYEGTRIEASRLIYDREADRLLIEGPIRLDDGESAILLADQAALDADLENGILDSARLVLDRQLQLAATRIARVGGRYLQLDNTVASACEICAANPTPTWEIRARKVIHDQQERQLYFEDASFRLFGLPVAYFPRLRLPDPTNRRATGLLIPRLRSTSQLGVGIGQPVFLTLGDHADLTLTPYLSPETKTFEALYRHAFRFGALRVRAAASDDTLLPDEGRYFFFAEGRFDLPRDLTLEFDVEKVSDPAYLLDYGYSDQDRLTTELRTYRVERDRIFTGTLSHFETLRESEIPIEDQLPSIFGEVEYERRLALRGGELRFGLDAATLTRDSELAIAGRDVNWLRLSAEYVRTGILPAGLVGDVRMGIAGAGYETHGDPRFDAITGRVTPSVSAELRWPLQRFGDAGVSHLVEPVVQLAWSATSGNDVPNEDSVLVEFDEGNLFSLSRFPGRNAVETGARANLGLSYTAVAPSGLGLSVVLGRVLRADDPTGFTNGSGLADRRSDWLAATRLNMGERLQVTARAVFDEDLTARKNEARLGYSGERLSLETGYVWLDAAPAENRPRDTHELAFDGIWRVARHWIASADARYDFNQDRAARAGLGIEYRTECISIDMGVSRRFTGSGTVEPSTDFGFSVSLAGFGSGRNDSTYRKTCNG